MKISYDCDQNSTLYMEQNLSTGISKIVQINLEYSKTCSCGHLY